MTRVVTHGLGEMVRLEVQETVKSPFNDNSEQNGPYRARSTTTVTALMANILRMNVPSMNAEVSEFRRSPNSDETYVEQQYMLPTPGLRILVQR
jgi:hypothetical protein